MRSSRIIAGLLLTLAAGCSPKALTFLNAPEPPILWPPAPDQPRIRYVGELTGSEDIGQQKTFGEVMDELLYGPKPKSKLVSPQSVAVNATGEKIAIADVSAKCVHVFDTKARKYASLVQVGVETFEQEAARQDSIGSANRFPTSSPAGQDTGGQAASGTMQDTGGQAASGTMQDAGGQAASGTELRRPGGRLESPVAVCWAGDSLWVADSVQHAIAIFERGGAGRWIAFDKLKRPAGLAYCPTNQLCYVSDAGAHRILAFDRAGRPMVEIGSHGNGPGQFNCPSHLACGPDGSLVVADSLNFRVQRLGIDGSPRACFGRKGNAAGDLALPKGVAVDASGSIWVVDAQFENVQAFTPDGQLLMAFGQEGHKPGEFWLPAGICIDGQNRMWVADRENGRVQLFAILP